MFDVCLVRVFFWPENPALLRNSLWLQLNAIIGHVKARAVNLISLSVHMFLHVCRPSVFILAQLSLVKTSVEHQQNFWNISIYFMFLMQNLIKLINYNCTTQKRLTQGERNYSSTVHPLYSILQSHHSFHFKGVFSSLKLIRTPPSSAVRVCVWILDERISPTRHTTN